MFLLPHKALSILLILFTVNLFPLGCCAQDAEGDDSPAGVRSQGGQASDGSHWTNGNGARICRDLPYTANLSTPLKADLYLPTDDAEAGYPIVIVVHGGAWRAGDKWNISRFSLELAKTGIASLAINYRLAPEHRFPAQIDDLRDALCWVADNAVQYDLAPQRIGMFGYSAGAHMVCLLGTLNDQPIAQQRLASDWAADDPRWRKLPSVRAIVAGAPPCDFREMPADNQTLAYFLGGSRKQFPQRYVAASPASFVSAGDVPTLYVHGDRDLIVPYSSSRQLFQRQQDAGVCSEYLTLSGDGHISTYLSPQLKRAVVQYLHFRLTK